MNAVGWKGWKRSSDRGKIKPQSGVGRGGQVKPSLFSDASRPCPYVVRDPQRMGRSIAVTVGDYSGCVWDLERGRLLRRLGDLGTAFTCLTVTPSGEHLMTGSLDGVITLWNAKTLKSQTQLQTKTGITSLALTPDGKRILAGSLDGTITLWDLETGQTQTFKEHSNQVRTIAISPDGKQAIVGYTNWSAILWDLETRRRIHTLKPHGLMLTASFSPEGRWAASFTKDRIVIWDLKAGQRVQVVEYRDLYRLCPVKAYPLPRAIAAVSHDGKYVITISTNWNGRLWKIKINREIHVVKRPWTLRDNHSTFFHEKISSIAVSQNEKQMMAGLLNGEAILWDLETGRRLHTLRGHSGSIFSILLLHGGEFAVTAAKDRTLCLWNIKTGKLDAKIKGQGHTDWVKVTALSQDGRQAITGSQDNTAIVWDLEHGRHIHTLKGHTNWVFDAAVSSNRMLRRNEAQ